MRILYCFVITYNSTMYNYFSVMSSIVLFSHACTCSMTRRFDNNEGETILCENKKKKHLGLRSHYTSKYHLTKWTFI